MNAVDRSTGLLALQSILVQIRWMAGERMDHDVLYRVLDTVELLPELLVSERDLGRFSEQVDGLARMFPEQFEAIADVLPRPVEPAMSAVG